VPLEKAKRAEPTSRSIREALGIAYFRIRRWEEAEAEFRALVELAPSDEFAHYALGRALVNQAPRRGDAAHQARALAAAADVATATRSSSRAERSSSASPSVVSSVGGDVVDSIGRWRRRAARSRVGGCGHRRREGSPGRSLGSGSSRTTTAASITHSSTWAVRRSSSASSRYRRHEKGQPAELHGAPRPEEAEPLYEHSARPFGVSGIEVVQGVFGARMEVALVNGPGP
jgi:tetratricopeptide (TPR) repeat protein